MKRLLKPNGVLAILGLYREETVRDMLWGMAAIPVHHLYHHIKRPVNIRSSGEMVVQSPKEGLQVIRETMRIMLPKHQFERHLFWRYSVVWQKTMDEAVL